MNPRLITALSFSRLFVVCFSLLAGCADDDMADLEAYVAEVKKRNKGDIEPLPDIKVVESFLFRPTELRDPFEPDDMMKMQEEGRVETGIRPDTLRAKEELESYELDTLRMVGTVKQGGVVWGLLKGTDNTIHRVRVGNYLGKNYGKIVSINDNQVEIVEIVADSAGAWHERRAGLELSDVDERD